MAPFCIARHHPRIQNRNSAEIQCICPGPWKCFFLLLRFFLRRPFGAKKVLRQLKSTTIKLITLIHREGVRSWTTAPHQLLNALRMTMLEISAVRILSLYSVLCAINIAFVVYVFKCNFKIKYGGGYFSIRRVNLIFQSLHHRREVEVKRRYSHALIAIFSCQCGHGACVCVCLKELVIQFVNVCILWHSICNKQYRNSHFH